MIDPLELWILAEAHIWRCSKCYEGDSREPSFYCELQRKLFAQWHELAEVEGLENRDPFGQAGYDALNVYLNTPRDESLR